jgi:GntR family transcriptional regulator
MIAQRRLSIPAYLRIYEELRARIRSGEWKVGDAVEPQRQLAQRFEVSVMTVRQALTQLERDGLIMTRHGLGTFVSAPKVNWNRLTSFTERVEGLGLKPSSRVLDASIVKADLRQAELLRTRPKENLIRVERLRMADGKPVAIEVVQVLFSEFPELLNHRLESTSFMRVLADHYHVVITHTDETIEARAAERSIAGLLQLKPKTPLIHLNQVLFTVGNRPVALCSGWYRADIFSFRIRRVRD